MPISNEVLEKSKIKNDHVDEVYIIMSPGGGIGLSFSGKGTCYKNLVEAESALKSKNEWSKSKGYGTYTLVPLKVKNAENEC